MAILSNINDKFAVDSTGAIQFNGQAGTSGYVLKSNGNAAPTWVDASTVIGGPYLPLSGGTLTGATATASGISFTVGGTLTGTTATFSGTITAGDGTQAINTDADLTLRNGNSFVGIDLKSARTSGNIGGLRYYGTSSDTVPKAQFLVETDGQLKYYNGTNGAQTRLTINSSGNATFAGKILVGTGATAAASLNAYTQTVSANLYSALRIIENSGASSYWDIGATGGGSPDLNFYVNAGTTPKLTISSSGNVTIGTGIINPSIGSDIAITQGAIGLRINDAASAISPTTATANNDNAVDLGVSNIRFRNLYMGGNMSAGRYLNLTDSDYTYIQGTHTGAADGEYCARVFGYGDSTFYGSLDILRHDVDDGEIRFRTRIAGTATDVMTIVDGNVGIGIDDPAARLEVKSNLYVSHPNAEELTFRIDNYGTTGTDAGPLLRLINQAGTTVVNIDSRSGSTRHTYFNQGGNVGIGTTSPSNKLAVCDSNGTGLEIAPNDSNAQVVLLAYDRADSAYREMNFNASDYVWRTSATERMRINSSGAVLIGATSALDTATRFQVSGNSSGVTSFSGNADDVIIEHNANVGITLASPNTTSQTIAFADPESPNAGFFLYDHSVDGLRIGTNGSERMRITSGGNVGIGTTSPTNGKFVINQNSSATSFGGNICQLFENFNTADGQMMSIGFRNNNSVGTTAYIDAVAYDQSIGATDIRFSTYSGSAWSSNMVTFQHTGRVGIGTTSPDEKLMVIGNIGLGDGTYNGGVYANSSSTAVDPNWGLEIQKTSGVTDWNTRLKYYPNSGNSRKAGIFDSRNNRFSLYSDTNNTPNIIIAYGNVGIGNTSPQTTLHVGTTTTVTNQFTNQVAASNFFVNGNANGGASFFQCKTAAVNINMMGNNDFACNQFTFYHKPLSTSQNIVGTITTFSSSTQYNTTSDYRLKENIIPLSDSITRLKQLKPSRFNFIEDPERTMDGFLAHEVQNIVPEAVNGEKDAIDENGNEVHQGIDQAKLVPLLVAAIQELEARVKELENK